MAWKDRISGRPKPKNIRDMANSFLNFPVENEELKKFVLQKRNDAFWLPRKVKPVNPVATMKEVIETIINNLEIREGWLDMLVHMQPGYVPTEEEKETNKRLEEFAENLRADSWWREGKPTDSEPEAEELKKYYIPIFDVPEEKIDHVRLMLKNMLLVQDAIEKLKDNESGERAKVNSIAILQKAPQVFEQVGQLYNADEQDALRDINELSANAKHDDQDAKQIEKLKKMLPEIKSMAALTTMAQNIANDMVSVITQKGWNKN